MSDYLAIAKNGTVDLEPAKTLIDGLSQARLGRVTRRSIAFELPSSEEASVRERLAKLGVQLERVPTAEIMEPIPVHRVMGRRPARHGH